MQNIFISNIVINKVRHLEGIQIPLSAEKMKHLIITGKNGSGKTILLNSIASFLSKITGVENPKVRLRQLEDTKKNLQIELRNASSEDDRVQVIHRLEHLEKMILDATAGVMLEMNGEVTDARCRYLFQSGRFVVAYYEANRVFKAEIPKHVEKIQLQDSYSMNEMPRKEFLKYLLDMKMTEALALAGGKRDKADKIRRWFDALQELLREIFEDDSVRLNFDEDTFRFTIYVKGREPFDFNTLSSGYGAVLEIVVDLMFRMEKQTNRVFDYSVPGIVLIDELETHLHLELQKRILKLLTKVFPNIQFIVSTHSPFILNCLEDVVIYDLENKVLVENGLSDIPYAGIVEGYFNADTMSKTLREKYNKYKELVKKPELTDEDMDEIAELEMYLNEIPDYLALNITTEYQRLKQELRMREDI